MVSEESRKPTGLRNARAVVQTVKEHRRWHRVELDTLGVVLDASCKIAARYFGMPIGDARDIAQEVGLKLCTPRGRERLEGLREQGQVEPFLWVCVRNAVYTYRRKRIRAGLVVDVLGLELEAPASVEEGFGILGGPLGMLDPIDQTIITRRYCDNWTSVEIAEEMRMEPPAVRQRLRRAIGKLEELAAACGLELGW